MVPVVVSKKLIRRSIVLLMMLVMLIPASSLVVSAKSVSKTIQKQDFTTSTRTINKKAAKVKKGTTRLFVRKGHGYVKFVAPKTRSYKFTFSKCRSTTQIRSGYVKFMRKDADSPQYCFSINSKVKTKGGKSSTLWLSVNGADSSSHSNVLKRRLASRTGKIKMKRGEVIYMYIYLGDTPGKTMLIIE